MFANSVRRDYFYLFLLLISQLIFQMFVYNSDFPGASGDDFYRALMTYEWRESPFLVSSSFGLISVIWFPTHFWFAGMVYMLTDNLVFSLVSISILFSLVELFILYHLSKNLFDKHTAFLTIVLVAFIPWQIWLSISMTEMTLYYASIVGAFLFYIKWQKECKPAQLLIASLFFLSSTMLRPEGWIFAVLFSGYLMLIIIRRRQHKSSIYYLILCIIISGLFIFLWLIHNFREFGNPFYFLHASKIHIQSHLNLQHMIFYKKSLQYPFLMLIVSPFIFLFSILSLFFTYKKLKSIQRNYLLFILAQLTVLMLASVYGAGTKAAPQRYVLINIILLAPFAARMLSFIWFNKFGSIFIVCFLSIYIGINCLKSFCYSPIYKDTIKIGRYLKHNFNALPSEQLCSEIAFRSIIGRPLNTEKDFLILSSEHAALEAYSEKPRNFLFNIIKLKKEDVLKSKYSTINVSEISAKLEKMHVRKIILQNRELMDWIPSDFHLEKAIGNYGIFSKGYSSHVIPSMITEIEKPMNSVNETMGKGIRLMGYKYGESFFPNNISLYWKLNRNYSNNNTYKFKMTFILLKNPEKRFERIVTPIFHLNKIGKISEPIFVIDNIALFLPPHMQNGGYSLKISLIEQKPNKEQDCLLNEIKLLPVTLIYSKRQVLANILKGNDVDWKLLAKTLLIL